ncbi:MAG: ribonuclease E/G [Lachnospiraceae bacterium]|nr:ribonuclease E/G [Lachnospiraceae bacterium]
MNTYKMHKLILTKLSYHEKNIFCGIYFDASNHPLDIMVEKEMPNENPFPNEAIYVGKVAKILPGQGAFVRLSPGVSGYLPLKPNQKFFYVNKIGKKECLQPEDEIVVQIRKQPIKTKEMVLDNELAFHSDHLILVTDSENISVSSKIKKIQKEHLKELLLNEYKTLDGFGFIVRTNALELSDEDILEEAKALYEEYMHVMKHVKNRTCFECIRKGRNKIEELLRTLNPEITEIETDDKEIFDSLMEVCHRDLFLSFQDKLLFYEDASYPLYKLYGMETVLDNALKPVAWLNSGANLIIEQVEAMTVIDVNSSKQISKKEANAFGINVEAAKEIALQLRLRNISGIVIVDFINMNSNHNKTALLSILKEETKYDPCKVTVLDYTKLGLVEITREKRYPSLKEVLTLK